MYSYVERTIADVMEEIARLSKDVHKVKEKQQRLRKTQERKGEKSILYYKSQSQIDRRLKELNRIHDDRVRMSDKSREP